jgi:two-component system sensor histidine kinase KdpD
MHQQRQARTRWTGWLSGGAAWLLGWVAAFALEGHAEQGSPALLLVLSMTMASLWWPTWMAIVSGTATVVAFNWLFISPRGTLQVSLERDLLFLCVMLAVSVGVTLLMARQRRLAAASERHAARAQELYVLSEALRVAQTPAAVHGALDSALSPSCQATGTIKAVFRAAPAEPGTWLHFGAPSDDEASGLALCSAQDQPMGPGTHVYDNQPGWYLPAHGMRAVQGAVLLQPPPALLHDTAQRRHAQAMCDLAGQAVEQLHAAAAAQAAQQAAQVHAFRNTMLAAVSHDYRTPLASILGAASSLRQQDDRLTPPQRQRLAATIVDEATQLSRLTDNALQLARLDGGAASLHRDWESLEELVGAVLRRVRARDPERRVRARLGARLPLVQCDAVLMVQLLENLIDNALKHAGPRTPIDIVGRSRQSQIWLAVCDRGPGIAGPDQARLLEAFERGSGQASGARGVRGAGLGLALCDAVARAHGARLALRNRRLGGCCVALCMPVAPPPRMAPETPP